MPYYYDSSMNSGHFKTALTVSLILHLIFLAICIKSAISSYPQNSQVVFSAEVVPLMPEDKQQSRPESQPQIVSPADQSNQDKPQEIRRIFDSEKDNYSPKEQIRRGDDGSTLSASHSPAQSKSEKTVQKAAKDNNNHIERSQQNSLALKNSKAEQKASATTPLKLKLDQGAISELSATDTEGNKADTAESRIQQAIESSAVSNEKSSINVSRIGSRDYLPDIPDGEVTLLNTKANKYAVFVRRVASQVFANLRGAGWRSLSATDIRSISRDAVFEAILSPQGTLLSVKMMNSSESRNFDQVLHGAIQKGAKDPNPPAGAEAEDGNIHFIFQARSWVKLRPNQRTGAVNEQRWLLLGTGLE